MTASSTRTTQTRRAGLATATGPSTAVATAGADALEAGTLAGQDVEEVAAPVSFEQRNRELFLDRIRIKDELAAAKAAAEAQAEAGRTEAGPGPIDRDVQEQVRRLTLALDRVTADIVTTNYGMVKAYVRRFTSHTSLEDSSDFESAGRVGLMRAIDSYHPDRGKFGAWAYKPIQREVLRAVRDSDHPNMNAGDFEARPEVLRALSALAGMDPDKRPSHEQIAERAGVTVDQVRRILDAPRLDSLSTPVGEDGDTSLGDLLEDTARGVEDTVLRALEVTSLEDFGLSQLTERELYVLTRRFGLDCEPPMCLSDVGESLGLSREAVRQIQEKALAKLNHPSLLRRLVRHGRN